MKKTTLALLSVCILSANVFGQTATIKTGDKAPKIDITDYIANCPKDKSLENKYILVEFWATWCAPCLAAVPHLNELKEKHANHKDLVFISMTDEPVNKVSRLLERIPFKTMVVSDQSQKTLTNFGVQGLPHTVLIDNKGIVKWIGRPQEMTDSMFEAFINGKNILITNNKSPEVKQTNSEPQKKPRFSESAMDLVKNPKTEYAFTLLHAEESGGTMCYSIPPKGRYIRTQTTFKSALSDILNIPEKNIIVPDTIKDKKFNILYKGVANKTKEFYINDLKFNLFKSFNLNERIEKRATKVYILRISDKSKLQVSEDKNGLQHSGCNDTHYVYSNIPVDQLIKSIGDSKKEIIINETNLTDRYNFLIRNESMNTIIKDLASYGLKLEPETREMDFYIYEF